MENRIKKLREEKKMTQIRLSTELEVTQETVSAYEIGKHQPSVKSLLKMAALFNASLDYIMGLSNIRLPANENTLPQNEAAILAMFRNLNQAQQDRAVAFMQGMLGE